MLKDELLGKVRLPVDGVRVEPGAMPGAGSLHKEQLHHLFEHDFQVHGGHRSPAGFRLRGGSVVQLRLNQRSRYVIRPASASKTTASPAESTSSSTRIWKVRYEGTIR
ncbi:MAG: hypothetical protein U0Q16_18980 [Bryobacteraceae bacterium]